MTGCATLGLTLAWFASSGMARATTNEPVFCDNFGQADQSSPALPWITHSGNWSVQGAEMCGGTNNLHSYGYNYISTNWTDYSIQAQVKFSGNAYGAGLGGRLDATTGAHYAVWIYPETSVGQTRVLRLVKFSDWGTWTLLQQTNLPPIGTSAHNLKLSFWGNQITAYFDNQAVASVTDGTRTSGGITTEMWTDAHPYVFSVDDVTVTLLPPDQNPNPIALPSVTISNIAKLADGNMHLVATGTPGQIYQLQASSDLRSPAWSSISTNAANGSGMVEFNDLGATNHPSRFYRIFTP